MPELPEVETVVRGLKKQIAGHSITALKLHYKPIVKNNPATFRKKVMGQKIITVTRHGKYIFIHLVNKKIIIAHLRMTGQLYLVELKAKPDKHTHLEMEFKGCKEKVFYRDIRKFGRFELIDSADYEDYIRDHKLAPDALDIKTKELAVKMAKKNAPVKAVLLDQTVIAGLGNIYVDEVLIRAGINPFTKACDIRPKQIPGLLKTIQTVLKQAILKKGTTFSDYVTSYGQKGKFQLTLKAYKQEGKPCFRCGTKIEKTRAAGRGTYFCPKCQAPG